MDTVATYPPEPLDHLRAEFETSVKAVAIERFSYSKRDALLKSINDRNRSGLYAVEWVRGAWAGFTHLNSGNVIPLFTTQKTEHPRPEFEALIDTIAIESFGYKAGDALLKSLKERNRNGFYAVEWVRGAWEGFALFQAGASIRQHAPDPLDHLRLDFERSVKKIAIEQFNYSEDTYLLNTLYDRDGSGLYNVLWVRGAWAGFALANAGAAAQLPTHYSIPSEEGLYWYFEKGARPRPVMINPSKWVGKFKSFNGAEQSWLREGEYLIGPQTAPVSNTQNVVSP
uniref:Uncharacterized protein n=2 Tax=Pseudomonas fluorescens TaxID=294 RepID=A0A0G4E534_PSEFS|nr:hypothetical protein PQBR57_0331 [Pseudomonas fluorescens SBW25]